mgnify:CR=1 FL=1
MSDPQWAPDPYGRFELRYWDGSAWTEHVHQRGVPGLDHLLRGLNERLGLPPGRALPFNEEGSRAPIRR